MKQQLNEVKRLQELAGLTNEKLLTMMDMDYLANNFKGVEAIIKQIVDKDKEAEEPVGKESLTNYIETLISRHYK